MAATQKEDWIWISETVFRVYTVVCVCVCVCPLFFFQQWHPFRFLRSTAGTARSRTCRMNKCLSSSWAVKTCGVDAKFWKDCCHKGWLVGWLAGFPMVRWWVSYPWAWQLCKIHSSLSTCAKVTLYCKVPHFSYLLLFAAVGTTLCVATKNQDLFLPVLGEG